MEHNLDKDLIRKRILEERKKQGLNQLQVAKKAKITPAALSQIEKGTRTPSSPVLYRIAKALGVSMDYLAGSTNNSELYDLLQSKQVKMFYKGFQSLDANDKELILKNIEFLKSKKEKH
jgi:transcriptional regulator with XRE-family HTH domain